MADVAKCLKCGGEMVEGFVLDRADHGMKMRQIWVAGSPEESFWANGFKTSDREIFNVQAFRCAQCSFLEFYTAEEAEIGGLFN